jgi:hypothetical protein
MKTMDEVEDKKNKENMRMKVEMNRKQSGQNQQKGRKEKIQDESRTESRDSES